MSGTQPFDIHELLRPEAFEHAAEDPKLIETHVSWVVLSGPFAYKIKKAIKLDFLDATDLAHRRFLCEEELRLNRRFAPELYLDVVAMPRSAVGAHRSSTP
jgi:aminoglycoside phosphotransferase family enzyme